MVSNSKSNTISHVLTQLYPYAITDLLSDLCPHTDAFASANVCPNSNTNSSTDPNAYFFSYLVSVPEPNTISNFQTNYCADTNSNVLSNM